MINLNGYIQNIPQAVIFFKMIDINQKRIYQALMDIQTTFSVPQKSGNDHQEYKLCTLPNGAKILMIHDPFTHKSSASISVGVGSLEDPLQCLGLAHLVEHMVYMGSKNFPSPNEYTEFISLNSGYQNAETLDENTNYYFQIANQAFQEAIIRTCDYLINPLLMAECIELQKQAINQQFILAQNDNDNRRDQIIRKFAITPYKKFSMGNNKTLSHPKIHELLVSFFHKYYSADIMNVVLYSNLSIEAMEGTLLKYFSNIPNKNCLMFLERPREFFKTGTQEFIKIQSLVEESYLFFIWSIQGISAIQRYQIFYYLQYLFHHNDESSLGQLLDELDYGCACQFQIEQHISFALFTLKIQLTEEGEQSLKYVDGVIRQYLNKYLVFSEPLFQEMKAIEKIKFDQLEWDDMEDYLSEICMNMSLMPGDLILSKTYSLFEKCSPQIMNKNLQTLITNSKKVINVFSSPEELKGATREEYYGTKYKISEKLSSKLPKKMPTLSSFKLNPFLPLPQIYYDSSYLIPNTPKILPSQSTIYFYNGNIPAKRSLLGSVKVFLHYDESFSFWHLFEQFMEQLTDDLEEAKFAGPFEVEYSFNYLYGQMYLEMNGIASILIKLLQSMGKKMEESIRNFYQDDMEDLQEIFQDAKQQILDNLDYFYDEDMDDLAQKIRDQILIKSSLPLYQFEKQIQKIKKKKFIKRVIQIWKECKLQWIFVGNFDELTVKQTSEQFQLNVGNLQKSKEIKLRQVQILKIPKQTIYHEIRLKDHQLPTSTCMIYYEIGKFSEQALFLAQFLANYLDEPYYSILRTQKKLSYDLELNVTNTRGILGINFLLVSSKYNPEKISQQIHHFLGEWLKPEKMMSQLQKKFNFLKNSVINKYLESVRTNEDMLDFISWQITHRTYGFKRITEQFLHQNLQNLEANRIIEQAQRIFENGCLQIFLVAKKHKNEYNQRKPKTKTLEIIKSSYEYHVDTLSEFKIEDFV